MSKTAIQWTEETWNPTRGCRVKSPGCKHCYAMAVAGARMAYPGGPYDGLVELVNGRWVWNGKARVVPSKVFEPVRRTKPTMFFVDSMSDLFYEGFSDDAIAACFGAMAASQQHTFQVLTKRPDRAVDWFASINQHGEAVDLCARALAELVPEAIPTDRHDRDRQATQLRARIAMATRGVRWPLPNVWMGTSVEDQRRADERLPMLTRIPAHVHFVSAEPLLERVVIDECLLGGVDGIDWVIVGGESGEGARPMDVDWARALRDQCRENGAAFFMKQLGSERETASGGPTTKKGGLLEELPHDLRIREMPRRAP